MVDQQFRTALTDIAARARGSPIAQQFQRVTGAITSFGRSNPLLATSIAGISLGGIVAVAKTRVTRRKKKATKKKRVTTKKPTRRRKKKTQAQIKRARLRNLAKARRARKCPGRRRKRRIIRGRGLGTREIRHSGKSTKGKFKLVSFRDKRTGKMIRFKAKK